MSKIQGIKIHMRNYCVVVPTIREKCITNFLEKWKFECTVILVEDNPEKTFKIKKDSRIQHYSWEDIDKTFGKKSWIISRRDSAIRSFGFYLAYKQNFDYIFTLDDDCYPIDGVDFFTDHINNLEQFPKWTESCIGYRTRGIPYKNLGTLDNVKLSAGLWEGVPDLDAIQTLSNQNIKLPENTRIIPKGQYYPLCGMNMCFKRDMTPLMWFPLMGEGSPYRRFDDIWCGIISKKIMDHLDINVAVGKPFIFHSRASDVFKNLEKETPGVIENEKFWQIIDSIKIQGSNILECMADIGRKLKNIEIDYYKKIGMAIINWVSFFE